MDYTAADLERIDDHAAQRLQHDDFLRNKPEYSDDSADLYYATRRVPVPTANTLTRAFFSALLASSALTGCGGSGADIDLSRSTIDPPACAASAASAILGACK